MLRLRCITLVCVGAILVSCGSEDMGDTEVAREPCTGERGVGSPDRVEASRDGLEATVRWAELADIPTPRIAPATAALDGRIHVLGGLGGAGSVHEIYDPARDVWFKGPDLPEGTNHGWAASVRGWLLAGGFGTSRVFCYDVELGTWTEVASSPVPHVGTPAVAVIDDRIYVAGGRGGEMQGNELSMYDPLLDEWASLSPMSCSRNHTVGGNIAGRMHVVGGRPGTQTCHEAYDPATDEWTRLPDLPTGREGMGGAVAGGLFFVIGGEGARDGEYVLFDQVEAYDPEANEWIQFPPMPTPRHGMFGAAVGDTVFLPGGGRRAEMVSANDVLIVEWRP